MQAYRYDKITKEFKGIQTAQPNPIEGGYLLPESCTFIEPPLYSINYIPVFVDTGWIVKRDNRDKWQVKLDDMTFSKVDYIGDAPIGYQVISNEVYINYKADNDRYRVIDGVFTDIIDTPEYKEIKRQKEEERIANLRCTKRVFALILQDMGISYSQLKAKIAENEQAQLEWDLCVELERKNPLLDSMAAEFGFTSAQVDNIFKLANGENG